MRFSYSLSLYIVRNFILYFAITLVVFLSISTFIDLIELSRKSLGKDFPFDIILEITLYKIPFTMQIILPFIIILASSLTYTNLNLHSELIAARSAGISAWQFILPVLIFVFVLGTMFVTLLNPLVALTSDKSIKLENKYFHNIDNYITISDNGIWLKDVTDKKLEKIIYAKSLYEMGRFLSEVTVFLATEQNDFSQIISADVASITNNKIILNDTKSFSPNNKVEIKKTLELATSLVTEQLQDNLKDPQTIGFWDLNNFLKLTAAVGFSILKYKLHLYNLYLLPFFLSGLSLLASSLSLTMPRKGKVGFMVFMSVCLGFIIYFLSKIINALGLSGSISLIVAAVSPVIICILSGVYLIFHYEDG